MSQRITKKMLENALNRLNYYAKKKYTMEGAYGFVRLTNETRSRNITVLMSKRELYYTIQAIIEFILNESRKNDGG